jgi:hypothetical protein
MIQNFRKFETGPDPFGRSWKVDFRWQQNAISIRHADAVDVKWVISCDGEEQEKVVALPHPALLALSKETGRELTDSWCMKLAGRHLIQMIATWEDMDKTLVTLSAEQLRVAGREQIAADAPA